MMGHFTRVTGTSDKSASCGANRSSAHASGTRRALGERLTEFPFP